MGQFILKGANTNSVDPGLLAWVQVAAANSPYDVVLYSGKCEGDPRFHGKGMATDVNLIDPKTGKAIPNYQNAGSFQAYQGFANQVRAAQMAMNPERSRALRWGGYFSGGKGKYGALDLMHFDVGGDTTPMGGGGWDTGLNEQQAALWGLTTGGGASVSPGVGTSLGDTFASAVDSPKKDFLSNLSTGLSGMSMNAGGGAAGNTLTGDATSPEPKAFEAPKALPSDLLDATGGNLGPVPPAGGTGSLADLFQVKTIGQPISKPGMRF